MTQYGDTYICVSIGSSKGLMPDDTKPLFGPDLYLSLSRPWIPVILHGICKTMLFISFQIITVARLRFKHEFICIWNYFSDTKYCIHTYIIIQFGNIASHYSISHDLVAWVWFKNRFSLVNESILFIYLFISLKPPKLGKYMYNIWTIST